MKTVLLNDKQRKKIVNLVKPKESDYYSYQNLNLLTAVYDEDKKIYLTLAYYLSSSIKRTDEYYKHSFSERFNLKKEVEKEMDLGGKGFTEWYLEKHYFEKKEEHG